MTSKVGTSNVKMKNTCTFVDITDCAKEKIFKNLINISVSYL